MRSLMRTRKRQRACGRQVLAQLPALAMKPFGPTAWGICRREKGKHLWFCWIFFLISCTVDTLTWTSWRFSALWGLLHFGYAFRMTWHASGWSISKAGCRSFLRTCSYLHGRKRYSRFLNSILLVTLRSVLLDSHSTTWKGLLRQMGRVSNGIGHGSTQ